MLVVGITGGIGSGKSIVCKVFEQLGIAVYNADKEARNLMSNDTALIKELKKQFGPDIFSLKEGLNRKKLAELVFNDKEQLMKLNAMVHPHVKKHFHKWMKEYQDSKYLVKEAAILFESGADEDCNLIITVVAPRELRIQRVMERDDVTKEKVRAIIDNQWSSTDKIKKSDYVIANDDHILVIPQVIELHETFLNLRKDYK
jgi:dephospho-CoA kinase